MLIEPQIYLRCRTTGASFAIPVTLTGKYDISVGHLGHQQVYTVEVAINSYVRRWVVISDLENVIGEPLAYWNLRRALLTNWVVNRGNRRVCKWATCHWINKCNADWRDAQKRASNG